LSLSEFFRWRAELHHRRARMWLRIFWVCVVTLIALWLPGWHLEFFLGVLIGLLIGSLRRWLRGTT